MCGLWCEEYTSAGRFNIKTLSLQYRNSHCKDKTVSQYNIKNSTLVDLVSRTIFGLKLAGILDFEPLGDQETMFEYFYHILHPQKHMFRNKVCGSVIIRSWGMEYPIFSYFLCGGHFENDPGEGVHLKFFLLTLQILIL